MSTQLALPLDGIRFRREGGLAQRALDLLALGPATTSEVAARVMGITNGARAAAAAVFALLGTDPRFAVDPEGVWSIREKRAEAVPLAPARRLRDEDFVVVDLETTGGSPRRGHRVTEVAAVAVSRGAIAGTYASLVNPGRAIPGMIASLTGISNEMVLAAPRFHQVADEVSAAIEGRVFVAHNAGFDWRFLGWEMQLATGMAPAGRQLCTVRMARKLLPELPYRNLDALAHYFGVEIVHRHRALDDAVATAEVLIRMLDIAEDRGAEDWEALQALLRKRARRKKRKASPQSMEAA